MCTIKALWQNRGHTAPHTLRVTTRLAAISTHSVRPGFTHTVTQHHKTPRNGASTVKARDAMSLVEVASGLRAESESDPGWVRVRVRVRVKVLERGAGVKVSVRVS